LFAIPNDHHLIQRIDILDSQSDRSGPAAHRDVKHDAAPALNRVTEVGTYPPNPWGLHDVHGNVFEWCRDWYHPRLPGGVDPDLSAVKGAMNRDGTYSRVRRGGAFNDDVMYCRSAFRLRYEPERGSDHIGFRVAAIPL
jgi:formylglycine-generating enzyme required for sulfatase activity